ncbi:EamA family transporter [Acinetobacter cumulans]|jgi:inner membrane transporter RhtA|uniref:EamA family transporter n=1 Tax=Acinetobacter cumulans TaxID=2136182 RepID=A0A498CY61_9GAMM|nr:MULTISPECIES: EamA family transporter [Acinetobacter]NWK72855.1 EamA family transporter [Acinetobacter sp. SwsAc6]QCO20433.1 EamA family transporter [Acinetobacter cumulans]RFS30616.1 EamA family transporter [Acinetobacter sp. SWAC5]RKG46132.1 EamA family transporter [Acinetobacter cumulans]RKG51399.1 EamA family transporter [Acinetobacter cumulans]
MPNFKISPTVQAPLILLIAMISMQSSGSFAKYLFGQFPILTVSAMRLLLGTLILALIFKIWQINFRQLKWSSILSYGLALAGMNILFYLSLDRLPLGIAVSFEFIGPLSVALFAIRRKFDLIWVGLAILGLILLFPFDQAAQTLDPIGIALALGAGACWALYIIAGQKPSGVSGNHTVCLGMFVGMCMLMPMALFAGMPAHTFEPVSLLYFIGLAVLASALPFTLEMIALRNLSALSFGTLMSLEPAVAALSGFVFLGEHLLWTQWLALAVIISASIGCTITMQKHKTAQN